MTLIYRTQKGAPLTSLEIDTNFKELDTRLKHLEERPEKGEGLGKVQVKEDQVTFQGTFGSDFGTFPLPKAALSLYEKTTLPREERLGKLALFVDGEGPTLIFFNGKTWQQLMKGETL
jgi:hypothetical protein